MTTSYVVGVGDEVLIGKINAFKKIRPVHTKYWLSASISDRIIPRVNYFALIFLYRCLRYFDTCLHSISSTSAIYTQRKQQQ